MYTVGVEASFNAVHRVRLADGSVENIHGHDWKVRACFTRAELDAADMVVDFLQARRCLDDVVQELHHTDLNAHPALGERNPTAEWLARYVFDRLVKAGYLSLTAVEVVEAPGCTACYSRPSEPMQKRCSD